MSEEARIKSAGRKKKKKNGPQEYSGILLGVRQIYGKVPAAPPLFGSVVAYCSGS